jgi:Leucine-rich repeat (LRR) protein
MLFFLPSQVGGQNNAPKEILSQDDMQAYLRQSEQLVKFMEFAFNTLGDPEVSAREKDIIINQSYLKFFSSAKVQIEDDLVEGRFVVTNKEVQAYLKDIDFFYKNAVFTFNIEDISYNVNESGQVFFIATTNRNLSGVSVEGDTIYNNQERFIEINLDREKRDLKIASIYTSKLSEKEDMRNWWATLDADWRLLFAKGASINEEFQLKDIVSFNDNWILIERLQVTIIEGFVMESRRADTIYTDPSPIYWEIRRIWKTETIDVTAYPYIMDISPLNKLTELKVINISGTHVDDLTPIRNLTRLENLNISGSYVNRLDPLRHAINLKTLDISNTVITDLSPLLAFPLLERLNLSNTPVTDLDPVSILQNLLDLRLPNTPLTDLSPLRNSWNLIVLDISNTPVTNLDSLGELQSLERLHADNTKITDLGPLSALPKLQYLFIEGTEVTEIQMLTSLPELKRIYCDRTRITREKANKFMDENPDVLVIYESQALTAWWAGLPLRWKEVFSKNVTVSEPPTREELHEVSNITHINISGNKEIFSVSPLQQLLRLRSLNAQGTNILSIEPLKENIDLVDLDISSTHVQDISVISGLRILESLKLSHTPVEDISPLASNNQLRLLDLNFSNVVSIESLAAINNLETVLCDGLELTPEDVAPVYDANPKVTIVFQSEALSEWWKNLPDNWISIFKSHMLLDNPPTPYQLHKLTEIHELDISQARGIKNLEAVEQFQRLQVFRMNDVQISDLTPLQQLSNLRELYCHNNPISNLKPLSKLYELRVLDCSNTLISNLNDLGSPTNLEVLNVSGTQIRNLRPLSNLVTLRQLDIYNTRVFSLRPIENLKNLELLRCYNTRIWQFFVDRFTKAVPDCEVVYY